MWRSKGDRVAVTYWKQSQRTDISAPVRTLSWQTGSSRVVGTRVEVSLPGPPGPADSATLLLTIRLVDSVPRLPEELQTVAVLDKTDTLRLPVPTVLPELGARVEGHPLHLIYALPDTTFRALAGAGSVTGTIGPHKFYLLDWEIHDINTLYRAVRCGVGL